jgi:uncharacterized membrane protein
MSYLIIGIGLLLIGLAIPLVSKKIPPNRWYGFRTPETLNNEELWYKANRYLGRDLIVYGGYWIASNLVVNQLDLKYPRGLLIWFGLIWVGMMVMVIRGVLYVNRFSK